MKTYKGYHGTVSNYAKKIETDGFTIKPSKPEDDHWLGHGIYFYEDYEDARYWAESKSKKKQQTPVVYKATLEANDEDIFDLDIKMNVIKLAEYEEEYSKFLKEMGIIIKGTDKQYRCTLLDSYKKEFAIMIISYTFENRWSWTENNTKSKVIDIKFKKKQLCATNSSVIKGMCKVFDSEESGGIV